MSSDATRYPRTAKGHSIQRKFSQYRVVDGTKWSRTVMKQQKNLYSELTLVIPTTPSNVTRYNLQDIAKSKVGGLIQKLGFLSNSSSCALSYTGVDN